MTEIEPLDKDYFHFNVRHLGINDSGQVAGASYVVHSIASDGAVAFVAHAFVTTDLGTLGGDGSYASAINNDGQVVGSAQTAAGISHAFITRPDYSSLVDLNSLVDLPDGVVLIEALDINNMGQIAVLAIPEPHTYALLLPGLILLWFLSFSKKPVWLWGHGNG
jgi:probable HAF family extracellular repeat protein